MLECDCRPLVVKSSGGSWRLESWFDPTTSPARMPFMPTAGLRLTAIMLVSAILAGCQDDPAKLLSDMGVSEKQLPQTQEASPPTTEPAGSGSMAAPIRSKPELPGGLGSYDLVIEPDQGLLKLRFPDAAAKGAPEVESATLSLAGAQGPVEIALEPCSPAEAACMAARSDVLRQPFTGGILRYEVHGQRFRAALSARNTASQPAASDLKSSTQPERKP